MNLTDRVTILEQTPPDKDQHIPGRPPPMGHPAAQRRVLKNTAAAGAMRYETTGNINPGEAYDLLGLALLHLQRTATAAHRLRRSEIDDRRLRK